MRAEADWSHCNDLYVYRHKMLLLYSNDSAKFICCFVSGSYNFKNEYLTKTNINLSD